MLKHPAKELCLQPSCSFRWNLYLRDFVKAAPAPRQPGPVVSNQWSARSKRLVTNGLDLTSYLSSSRLPIVFPFVTLILT